VLTSKTFLPNEGATEGRQLYRESLLMMAFDDMEKGKYQAALSDIEKARQWPENLGVGKPYESDIDERFENFQQALCLEKMKKKPEADKIYSSLTKEKTNIQNANLLINALAWKKTGAELNGTQLLNAWKEKSSDKSIPDGILQIFNQGSGDVLPNTTDQLRLLNRLSHYLNTKN
jgi:hypothetical protein